jgi:hypothetical protein
MQPDLINQEQNKRLIAFRQTLYEKGFTQRRDAQFELLDALLLFGPVRSFAELSLSPTFHSEWPSVYAALEDGRQDDEAIRKQLVALLPSEGIVIFALDATFWRRPCSPTLPDRQDGHASTEAGDTIQIGYPYSQIGYPYSILAWAAEAGTCWTLPLDVERIPSNTKAVSVGVEQIKRLLPLLPEGVVPIFVGDGGYGNHHFLQPLKDERGGRLVRLRKDRVLYREPGSYPGIGRPPKHGERFVFKDPATWGEPEETLVLEDPKWGTVEIRFWRELHAKAAADTPLGVLRVQTHTEREKLPEPLWLAWKEPSVSVEPFQAEALCRGSVANLSVAGGDRTESPMEETRPRLDAPSSANSRGVRPMDAVDNVGPMGTLFGSSLVLDAPLPWQPPQAILTPSRVQRRLGSLFVEMGTPAREPQTRGKSRGWPKGKPRSHPERYKIVKKTAKTVPKRSNSPPVPSRN